MDTARILKRQRALLHSSKMLSTLATEDFLTLMAAYDEATSKALVEALERIQKEN